MKIQGHPGEFPARALVLQDLATLPDFFYSSDCCAHQLPFWHQLHEPFQAMLVDMIEEFDKENDLRRRTGGRPGIKLHESASVYTGMKDMDCDPGGALQNDDRRPLFSLGALTLETVPSASSLDAAQIHSTDVGGWEHRYNRKRPPGESTPWLSDVTSWVEDHSNLYNTSFLMDLTAEVLEKLDHVTYSSEFPRYASSLLCRRNLAALRHNEHVVFLDSNKPDALSFVGGDDRRPLAPPDAYKAIDYPQLQALNLANFANTWSPTACITEAIDIQDGLNLSMNKWCSFPDLHLAPSVAVPSFLHTPNTTLADADPMTLTIIDNLFRLAGYEFYGNNESVRRYVQLPLPHTRHLVVMAASQEKKNHLALRYANVLEYTSNGTAIAVKSSLGLLHDRALDILVDPNYVPSVVDIDLNASIHLVHPPWFFGRPHDTQNTRSNRIATPDLNNRIRCRLCALRGTSKNDPLLNLVTYTILHDDHDTTCRSCSPPLMF